MPLFLQFFYSPKLVKLRKLRQGVQKKVRLGTKSPNDPITETDETSKDEDYPTPSNRIHGNNGDGLSC